MFKLPSWSVVGVVSEVRALETKPDGNGQRRIWAHSVKIAGMGGQFETTTKDETTFKGVGVGMAVEAEGGFSFFGGHLKMDLVRIAPYDVAAAAAGRATGLAAAKVPAPAAPAKAA